MASNKLSIRQLQYRQASKKSKEIQAMLDAQDERYYDGPIPHIKFLDLNCEERTKKIVQELEEKRREKAEKTYREAKKPIKPDSNASPSDFLAYQVELLKYHALKLDIKHPDDARVVKECAKSLESKMGSKKQGWQNECLKSLGRSKRVAVFEKHRGIGKIVANIVSSLFVLPLLVSLIGATYNKARTGRFTVSWWQTTTRQKVEDLEAQLRKDASVLSRASTPDSQPMHPSPK